MYAAGLGRFIERFDSVTDGPADIPDVLAKLLLFIVRRRLRRNLLQGYECKRAIIARVRGRIELLKTLCEELPQRGRVACRFQELTIDTPRNRLVRAALERLSAVVHEKSLSHECRSVARSLVMLGVTGPKPTGPEVRRDQIAPYDTDDLLMVSIAELSLRRLLPSETAGDRRISGLARQGLSGEFFEKAIAGFYRHELPGREWRVYPSRHISWPVDSPTSGLKALLPEMKQDIVLEHSKRMQRIVIDTKFKNVIGADRIGGDSFHPSDVFQLYSYLRSQSENDGLLSQTASGILLHPSVGRSVDEAMTIQGHRIRFATVDLSTDRESIRHRLLDIVNISL